MGLHYLTFMGRKIENRKKLTFVRMMNSVNLISKNNKNSVGVFEYSVAMNSDYGE